jgi:hypothetical protein
MKIVAKILVLVTLSCVLVWPVPSVRATAIPGGTLDPTSVPKYWSSLIIPPAMPKAGEIDLPDGRKTDYYEIAVRQFQQDILPSSMGLPTTVWSYGSLTHPGTVAEGDTFNYPALTIEATHDKPVRVKWVNGLVDEQDNFLPHLLPEVRHLNLVSPCYLVS